MDNLKKESASTQTDTVEADMRNEESSYLIKELLDNTESIFGLGLHRHFVAGALAHYNITDMNSYMTISELGKMVDNFKKVEAYN